MFKKILAFFTAAIISASAFIVAPFVHAQAGGATKFQITAPATAVVGEAFDITVTALDKDGKKATGYLNSIMIWTDNIGDTYPMPGRLIPFTAEDAGEKKFSKGVIFKKAGKQKLYVQDGKEDIAGEVTITVEEGNGTTATSTGEIQILTPTADSKITTSTLLVSGTARKNSKVSLNLNGENVGTVVSDSEGLFTKEISNISQENNVLKASLIDANNSVIATSSEIRFSKINETSSIYGLSISPSNKVESSAGITLTIDAIKGLSEVTAMMDGTILKATESSEGKYTIATTAPQKAGEYAIDVTAKTVTNQTTTKEKLATLTVTKKEKTEEKPAVNPAFKNVKAETDQHKITFTFSVENAPADLNAFKIFHNSGSVVTHSASKILKDGVYSWYIDSLAPGQYTFQIQGQNASGALIENLKSEPIMATIGALGCTVSNVGKISVKTDTSKSVLTWEAVTGANGYNVYKIDAEGKYNLVTHVKDPSYTLYLSQGAITYDNFGVKATCGENTESQDFSGASKVQTGPGMVALVVIISGFVAAMVLRRRDA